MSEAPLPAGYVRTESADPYERNNALEFVKDLGGGRVEVGLMPTEIHANEYDRVHGGVLMMLADAALCMNSRWHDPQEGSITVNMTSNFVSGAKIGEFLESRSRVVRRTRQFSFVDCEIVTGDRVIMTASGIIKRLLPQGDG